MYTYEKEIPFNFGITKNIPIDTRYLITNLGELTTRIPVSRRYPGLIFFVTNDTPDYQGNTGFLYVIDNDLQPIKLFDFLMRYIKFGLQLESDADYGNIEKLLNEKTYPKLGSMVYVSPIGVTYVYNGSKFVYFAGDYHFTKQSQYDSLPAKFKQPNAVVYIGDTKYVIKNDLTLSPPLLVYNRVDAILTPYESDRYYLVNGILYYCFEGTLYSIGNKIYLLENTVLAANQAIKHNLNTYALKAYFRIHAVTGQTVKLNPSDINRCLHLGLTPVDLDNCTIDNAQLVTGDLHIVAMM